MDCPLRLIGFLVLLCTLTLPCFSQLLTPQEPPVPPVVTAPQEPPVRLVAIIPLQWISTREMRYIFTQTARDVGNAPVTGWQPAKTQPIAMDFLPEGILDLQPLGQHALYAIAETEEAVTQLREFIAFVDKPVKQVQVEATLLAVTPESFPDLCKAFAVSIDPQLASAFLGLGALRLHDPAATLKRLLKTRSAKVAGRTRAVIDSGSAGFLDFGAQMPGVRGILIDTLTVHPDDTLTIGWHFVQQRTPADAGVIVGVLESARIKTGEGIVLESAPEGRIFRIRTGEGIVLAGEDSITGFPPNGARTKSVLLISGTILKEPAGKAGK